MRILYGVQTTGRGHLVRSRPMVTALRSLGHDVQTLFSGPSIEQKWLDPAFSPYEIRRGLTFVSRKGRIQHLATGLQLRLGEMEKDIYAFDASGIDVVVSDYEPITSRIAWLNDIPCVGIGHLYAFAFPRVPVAGFNLMNQMVMKYFAPATIPLGMHWHHFDAPILPPTIALDDTDGEDGDEELVLVYAPFESTDDLVRALAPVTDRRFRIYCQDAEPGVDGNIETRALDRDTFVADLLRCGGVISNTGFTFISEALHIGKKILTKPLTHQTEQESNALALQQLGLGTVVRRLTTGAVRSWVELPSPEAARYPDVLAAIVDWIDAGQWDTAESLASDLWSRTAVDSH